MGFFVSTKNCMWKVKSGDCGTEKVASWDGDFFSILLLKNVNVFFIFWLHHATCRIFKFFLWDTVRHFYRLVCSSRGHSKEREYFSS